MGKIVRALSAEGGVLCSAIDSTDMVKEMAKLHMATPVLNLGGDVDIRGRYADIENNRRRTVWYVVGSFRLSRQCEVLRGRPERECAAD